MKGLLSMLDASRERKAGVFLGYINYLIRICIQLIYVPVMLKLLGQSEYGVYQLVASLIAYLNLLNFGFSGAYLRFYAKCKGDKKEEATLNGTYLLVFSVLGLIAFFLGLVMTFNSRVILGTKLTSTELELAKVLFFILSINMAITFPISVLSSIVTAKEEFLFQKIVEILKTLANPCFTIVLLILGKGSVGLVIITTVITLISGIVNLWYVLSKLKIKFSFVDFDTSLVKEVSTFSFFIFLSSVIDQINWNVDKFILGRIVGTTAIAVYSVGAQINNLYISASDMTAIVMAPKVNNIVATEINPMPRLNDIFIKVGRIQAYIVLFIVTGFIVLGREFITLWAGEDYVEAYIITLLLIVPAAIPLIQSIGIDIQRALNKHQIRSVVYAGISVFNIFISVPLVYKLGATGAAIGTAIALLFGNGIIMNVLYIKYIGLDVRKFWKKIFPIFCTPILAMLSIFVINKVHADYSWFDFILKGILFTSIYGLTAFFITSNKEEKSLIRSIK